MEKQTIIKRLDLLKDLMDMKPERSLEPEFEKTYLGHCDKLLKADLNEESRYMEYVHCFFRTRFAQSHYSDGTVQ